MVQSNLPKTLMALSTAVILAGACLLLIVHRLRLLNKRSALSSAPLPPGPPRLPIIGSLFDLPRNSSRVGYRELSKKYGNLVYMKVLGRSILVINDAQIAIDLLEKRSAIYSSRVSSPIIPMIAQEWNFAFMPYGEVWRTHRRMFSRHFNSTTVAKYQPVQKEAVTHFLRALLDSPDRHREHLHFALGALIIKAVYGLDSGELNDKYIRIMENGSAANQEFLANGSILEYFPIWAHAPLWLPGTGVVRQVAHARKSNLAIRDHAWADAVLAAKSQDSGGAEVSSCMVQTVIEEYGHDASEAAAAKMETAKNVAALCYEAGVDTQLTTVESFLLAMATHPEVQRKAQAELDAVVGPHRLPDMADRDALPYLNAILKETMRWHTAVPLGLFHMSTADDEYNGYFIPNGTMIVANAWSILHDPGLYPEPDKFIPERFLKDGHLNPDIRDPGSIAFGFGRRTCPGRFLADGSVFLFMASILHTFDLSPPLDEYGKPVHLELRGRDGLTSFIEDNRCTFKVRSSSAEERIRRHG